MTNPSSYLNLVTNEITNKVIYANLNPDTNEKNCTIQ